MSDYTEFVQTIKGWPKSGFQRRTITLKVRRVDIPDRNEAQIEIQTDTVKDSGRLFTTCAGFTLSPDNARKFANALLGTQSWEELGLADKNGNIAV